MCLRSLSVDSISRRGTSEKKDPREQSIKKIRGKYLNKNKNERVVSFEETNKLGDGITRLHEKKTQRELLSSYNSFFFSSTSKKKLKNFYFC